MLFYVYALFEYAKVGKKDYNEDIGGDDMKKLFAFTLSLAMMVVPVYAQRSLYQVGKTSYTNIERALEKANDKQNIVVKSDITKPKDLTYSLNKKVTIDGQKHRFTSKKITVYKGQITLKNSHLKASIITVNKGASLTLEKSHVQAVIINHGTISGDAATLKASKIENFAKMTMIKTTVNGNIYNSSQLLIKSGTYQNIVQNNAPKALLTIKNGTFKELSDYSGLVNISGGNFIGETSFYQEKGKVSGGTFNVDHLTNYADGMQVIGSNLKSIVIS